MLGVFVDMSYTPELSKPAFCQSEPVFGCRGEPWQRRRTATDPHSHVAIDLMVITNKLQRNYNMRCVEPPRTSQNWRSLLLEVPPGMVTWVRFRFSGFCSQVSRRPELSTNLEYHLLARASVRYLD